MKKYILLICFVCAGLLSNIASAMNYDNEKVADARLSWNNKLRDDKGLVTYTYDDRLDKTANEWSEYMANLGTWTHKRLKTDGFYNYKSIGSWFAERGLYFANVKSTTYTENVGVGYVKCKEDDCTDEVIKAIKTTWTFYMGEVKYNGAHYRSLVNKNFRVIGFGLYIDKKNKYYLTIHYGTKILEKDDDTQTEVSKTKTTITTPETKPDTTKSSKIAESTVNISEIDKRPVGLTPLSKS